jgi:hypothetical protein
VSVGTAQGRERLGEPRASHRLAPGDIGRRGRFIPGDAGSRQHAHRLAERQAVGRGTALDRLELFQSATQPGMVDLDPLAADQCQAVGMGEQPLDLGRRQFFAVERDFHGEFEERVDAQRGRRPAADRRLDLGTRGPVHAPTCRQAHDHAGAFERRRVLEEQQRLLRGPAQRMKYFARIHHGFEPPAKLGGALDRHQQRQQALAVLRAGIFLQRLAERHMLRLGRSRQAGGVGREKRKGSLLVLAILREIEMHASDQVPGRIARFEKSLDGKRGVGELHVEGLVGDAPQVGERRRRQVFRAGHRRDRRRRRGQLAFARERNRRLGSALAELGQRAQRSHVTRTEIAPI